MLLLAFMVSIGAAIWTVMVIYGNAMKPAGGHDGADTVVIAWLVVAVLLLGWALS